MRRQNCPEKSNDTPLNECDWLVEISVPVPGRIHEQVLGWLCRSIRFYGATQATRGIRHKATRMTEDSLEGQVVSQARSYCGRAPYVRGHIFIGEIVHIRLNNG
jgi:hypothetical protein